MRLAWFTPLPPVRSGVAQYNAELLPGLASIHAIDVFVEGRRESILDDRGQESDWQEPTPLPVFNAHDFVWKHLQRPYDLIVYQLGNATCHDYIWAYLVRYPGLVVLHDGQLHHARGRSLLQQGRNDDYRREFAYNHPDADGRLAEVGIAGLLGSLTYFWPMRRIVARSARLVAVHNDWLADRIREEEPDARVAVVRMGVPALTAAPDAGASVRARHAIPPDAVLFVALGDVTPEKRISQAIHALASVAERVPRIHLLLAGKSVDYYDAQAEAAACGVAELVTSAGYVAHDELPNYLEAADVCLCMRWPSSRETSAAWLRCLAAGRPTIITDLAHTADIPALDPRTWALMQSPIASESPQPLADPVSVSIDIVDEDHSLRLAIRRLAVDSRLRAALGQSARQLWQERFTIEAMHASYLDVIVQACARPKAACSSDDVPTHFVTDGTEHLVSLIRGMGLSESRIADILRAQP